MTAQRSLFGGNEGAQWKRLDGYDWTICPTCGLWHVWSYADPIERLAELCRLHPKPWLKDVEGDGDEPIAED